MTLFEDITKYLQPDSDGISAYFTGQTLCIVALLCWYMMVARDVSQALMLHRAMMALPTSGRTKIEPWVNTFTQVIGFRLKSATRKRKLVSYFLLGYRLLSDAFLVYVGSLFLAYTVNVTELLLNAVSLGIILDIDNYIFWGCAPTAGRDLLDRFEALHVPSYPRVMGADVKSILLCGAVPALALAVYLQVLEPMTRTLAQVRELDVPQTFGFQHKNHPGPLNIVDLGIQNSEHF